MQDAKDTARALVKIGYDGTVHKFFRHKQAEERFENELRVLKYLEERGCDFVPRVLDFNAEKLELVTSNCGQRVQQMSDERMKEIFAELESYGVRHDDPFLRNITYRSRDGRFCVIDFEFATILDEDPGSIAPGTPPGEQGTLLSSPRRPMQLPSAPRPPSNIALRWSGAKDPGKFRPNNEDEFLAVAFNMEEFIYLASQGEVPVGNFDFVFAVSDGMGGERSGEFASKFALDNITRLMSRRYQFSPAHYYNGIHECLEELFQAIHRQLTTLGNSYQQGHNMGATLSMVWYVAGCFYFGHIGDSRIYFLPRQGEMRQLTDDHTHVGWLRRQGRINEREMRYHPRKNVLAQALGAGNRYIIPHLGEIRCQPGDKLVLCSDGVVEGLWDRGIEEIVRSARFGDPGGSPAQKLVSEAVSESGRDNASAVVVEVASA